MSLTAAAAAPVKKPSVNHDSSSKSRQQDHHSLLKKEGKEEEVDAFYEFHTVSEDNTDHQPIKPNKVRRRSISLTDDADQNALILRKTSSNILHQLHNELLHQRGSTEDVYTSVRLRSGSGRDHIRHSPSNRQRRSGSPAALAVLALQEIPKEQKRPSSVLIHDNDELIRLAEALQLRDAIQEESYHIRSSSLSHLHPASPNFQPPIVHHPSSNSLPIRKDLLNNSPNSLVRRNSSGYSTGSCSSTAGAAGAAGRAAAAATGSDVIGRTGNGKKKKHSSPAVTSLHVPSNKPPNSTAARRGSVALAGPRGGGHKANNAEVLPQPVGRRSSVCVEGGSRSLDNQQSQTPSIGDVSGNGNQSQGKSRLTFSSLFGSTGKRSSVTHSAVQHKIAKKYDRSSSGQISEIKVEVNEEAVRARKESVGGQDKRLLFLQTKSSTSLNLFGARRRSIAITDDAYNAAMRSAKSHVDLSQIGVAHSPMVSKRSTAAPSLSDLQEGQNETEDGKQQQQQHEAKHKISFKDRSWTEIEKLWKGKAKEAPNIENLFKPRSSFRNKDRSARSKTIPLGQGASSGNQSGHNNWSQCGSPKVSKLSMPALQQSQSSPSVTKKAIDLLAPHIFSAWQKEQGYPPVFQRYTSMPANHAAASNAESLSSTDGNNSNSQDSDHFEELVRDW